jgi:hypothetical protein
MITATHGALQADERAVIPRPTLAHWNTYERIRRYRGVHNLRWREVRSILVALADVVMGRNGTATVTRNRQALVLRRDRRNEIGTRAPLKELRGFLER